MVCVSHVKVSCEFFLIDNCVLNISEIAFGRSVCFFPTTTISLLGLWDHLHFGK